MDWLPSLSVFTDASVKGEDVGIGWVVFEEDYILEEDSVPYRNITTHTAEVMAVVEVMKWIQSNLLRRHRIYLLCDSQSAVAVLNGVEVRDSTSAEALDTLKVLRETHIIEIKWVKGHSKTTGNEYADTLAREGRERAKELSYTTPFMPISTKEVKRIVHKGYLTIWQKRWESTKDCHISKQFYPEVREIRNMLKFNITELQSLAQVITGHGLYKYHLRHWNEIEDYSCSLCGEAWEDTWHLWNLCPGLEGERREIAQKLKGVFTLEKGILQLFKSEKVLELTATNESMLTPT